MAGMKAPLNRSIEFTQQAKGTLKEIISANDLPKLNHALSILFADLRHASSHFRDRGDNGRLGAAVALGAVWRFVVLFEQPLAECLHLPLLKLQNALVGLENNQVEPIIRPVPRKGRSSSSDARAALKGHAAGTVERLRKAGIPRAEALNRVAKTLAKLGVTPERGSGHVTATTIRHWCGTVAEDVARSGTAATVFDSMFTTQEEARFAKLPSRQAQTFALQSLEGFVRALKVTT